MIPHLHRNKLALLSSREEENDPKQTLRRRRGDAGFCLFSLNSKIRNLGRPFGPHPPTPKYPSRATEKGRGKQSAPISTSGRDLPHLLPIPLTTRVRKLWLKPRSNFVFIPLPLASDFRTQRLNRSRTFLPIELRTATENTPLRSDVPQCRTLRALTRTPLVLRRRLPESSHRVTHPSLERKRCERVTLCMVLQQRA